MKRNIVKNIYLVKKRHAQEERLESVFNYLIRLGKALMILVMAAVVISGGWLVRDFLLVTPYFNVKTVKVIGNDSVPQEDILNLSGIKMGENIFKLDLTKIQCLIKQNPLLDCVYVKRHIPNMVEISVKERKAIALLNVKGKIYRVDENSVIFQKLSLPLNYNLPIISNTKIKDIILGSKNDSVFLEIGIKLLKDIMVSDSLLIDDISEINLGSLDEITIYTNKGIRLKVNKDVEKYKWFYINRVINIASTEKINIDYLDMRYSEQIILKPLA